MAAPNCKGSASIQMVPALEEEGSGGSILNEEGYAAVCNMHFHVVVQSTNTYSDIQRQQLHTHHIC